MAKKNKRRRRQQSRLRRATQKARRRRARSGNKPAANLPVLFDQDEAAAIAGLMVGGSQEFAGQFGELLHESALLRSEPEFRDLQVHPAVFDELVAAVDTHTSATGAPDNPDTAGPPGDSRSEIAHRLMQTDFRDALLESLDQFIERTRDIGDQKRLWRSAVSLKFLLEQPTGGSERALWSTNGLIMALLDEAAQVAVGDDSSP